MTALLPVLKAVKEKNLKLAMHLSEVRKNKSKLQNQDQHFLQIPARNEETLLLMKGVTPDRIGHGTYLHPDVGGTEEIVHEVTSRHIPIGNVCYNVATTTHCIVTSIFRAVLVF